MKSLFKKFNPLTEERAMIIFSIAFILGGGAFWIIPLKFYQYGGLTYLFFLLISLVFFTIPALGAEMLAGRVSQTTLLDSFSALRRPRWMFLGILMIIALLLFALYFSGYVVSAITLLEKSWVHVFNAQSDGTGSLSGYVDYVNILIAVVISYLLLSPEIYRNENLSAHDIRLGIPVKIKTFSYLFSFSAIVFVLVLIIYLWISPVSISRILELFFSFSARAKSGGIFLDVLTDTFFIFLAGRGVLYAFSAYFKKETGITTFAIRLTSVGILIAFIVSFFITGIIFFNETEGNEISLQASLLYDTIPMSLLKLPAGNIMLLLFSSILCIIFCVTLAGWMEIIGSSVAMLFHTSRSLSLKLAGITFLIVFLFSKYYKDITFNIPSYTHTTYKYISPEKLATQYELKDWEQIKFAVSGSNFPEKYFSQENIPEPEREFFLFRGNKETETISVICSRPVACTGVSALSHYILKTYLIPVLIFLVCLFVGWILPESVKRPEFARGDSYYSKYYNIWNVLIKYVVPGTMLILLYYG